MPNKALRSFIVVAGLLLHSVSSYGLNSLPDSIEHLIKKSSITKESITISVEKISRQTTPTSKYISSEVLNWQDDKPMNPASTMKLVTSLAAMEVLGPQYRWKTDLFTNGQIQGDTLRGDLLLKGSGDPKLIPEEINKILNNLKDFGIKKIDGDLIFDRSAYDSSVKESSFSDGETTRSYNVLPDALLFAFNSFSFQFFPSADSQYVIIKQTPRIANLKIDNNLRVVDAPCNDWRRNISMSINMEKNGSWLASFDGEFPNGCPTANWNVVASNSDDFLSQSIIAAWEDAGGVWLRPPKFKEGQLTNSFKPLHTHYGIPLYESVRDVNKLSNNVMAKQLMLTLALERNGRAQNNENAAAIMKEWLKKKNLEFSELVIENGSGLSRIERISSQHLNEILMLGINSFYRDYFVESLPIAGVDGTMKHRLTDKLRQYFPSKKELALLEKNTETFPVGLRRYGAYIKTGSLVDVRSISGYVVSRTGQVYAVSSMINHSLANTGRPIHDALLSWLLDDGPSHQ